MKRLLAWLFIVAVIVTSAACSTPTQKDAGTAKKALYVGTDSANDRIVMKHLKELGYEVTLLSDKELTPEQAQNYGFVFVSSFAGSHRVADKLLGSTAPVIYANGKILGQVGLASKDDSDYGEYTGRAIAIKDSKHELAAGLPGSVDIYKDEAKISYVVPQGGVIVASAPDNDKRAVICAFEKGDANMSGQPLPARRMFFNLTGGEEINRTDNGWKLFDAAVAWSVGKK
ncbi:hypothetical protein [Paenibacillus aceris]|uniref:Uncharacterized protein n=1 Tax=Paenibacillus aceris TaxID=869555 RepID=A0ABS4HW53_9BACL|nr:hypothetical protein [Paenibacillus aceris]MBP1962862.1 hypothetical protein [Paenibacillus aceris]NHW38289.1 hypothetical protein [Paenibacillus aceris]